MLALRSSEKCVLHCSYIELYSKYLVVLTRIVKIWATLKNKTRYPNTSILCLK